MPEHGPEQILDIVRVQPRLGCLGAPCGDEVFLPGRVKGGEFLLLLDFRDLLDDAAPLRQQVYQLLVNAVNLFAQAFEAALGGCRIGGARGGARAMCPGFWLAHGVRDPPLFLITSLSLTGAPPCCLLASAASMKARISIVSRGCTGGTPVLKNSMMATTSGW